MMHNKASHETKTSVWWAINRCPIPDGIDPRLVRPRIESALKNSGYSSGPLTIIAAGNLTQTHGDKVLRELSSTGIALMHTECGFQTQLFKWCRRNPPPATLMLIAGPFHMECLARSLDDLQKDGYTILLAYTQRFSNESLWTRCLSGVSKEWTWKSLLDGSADDKQEEATRQENKCSSEYPWFCTSCYLACQSFEQFTTHLNSKEHAEEEED